MTTDTESTVPATIVAFGQPLVTTIGWDADNRPMWRYVADMDLPDHARRIVVRADIPVRI